jgi:lysophospholipase L1-like esterase
MSLSTTLFNNLHVPGAYFYFYGMHKPWHTLAFGLSLFVILGLLGFIFPPQGIKITADFTVRYPQTKSLLSPATKKPDISAILKKAAEPAPAVTDAGNQADTSFIIEGAPKEKNHKQPRRDSVREPNTGIQYKNPAALENFYEALTSLQQDPSKKVRVMHYGDSQIEGDRITDFLRMKWQTLYGGGGPGLISLMPLTSSIINKVSNGPGWDRFNVFTAKDKRVQHGNYGVLAGFTRFCQYKRIYDTSVVLSTSLSVITTKFGGPAAMAYNKIKLFYGGAQRKTWCEFYDGPALMGADSLEAGGNFRVKEFRVGKSSFVHTFKFKGKDSPDFYAISLESDNGILVDNIALRGSSGTFFHLVSADQFKQFYKYLQANLIILQFGGNALPAIENETMAVNYAAYLKGQIAILKKLAPEASILFVGPSDMNIKVGMDYVTYPYLEIMRDAIKKAVLESGCAFYDLYDSMGGRNSMSAWVDEKLAATDYIHFSPQGARKIAALFYTALMEDYQDYLKKKK